MRLRTWTRRMMATGCAAACVCACATVLAAAPNGSGSILLRDGVPASAVGELGPQAAVLAQLVSSGTVPPGRAATAADSLLRVLRHQEGGGGGPGVRPAALPPIGDCSSGGGASYDVFTTTAPGFTVESGTVTLGAASNADPTNDAFYASLGAYTVGGSVDVGIWTGGAGSGTGTTWYGYANGTRTGWAYSDIAFAQAQNPTVILAVLVGADVLTLDVLNAATDAAIGSSTFSEPGYGLTPAGGGVGLYRFDSLAQNVENLSDGSSLTAQAWGNLTATPAGGSAESIVPSLVATAGPECSRPERRTVKVLSQAEWSASDVSIVYGGQGGSGGGGGGRGPHR